MLILTLLNNNSEKIFNMKSDKEHEIKITPSAIARIKKMTAEEEFKGMFFRVEVLGGGCSGFQYDFSFDDKQDEDDLKHENILIGKKSAELLKGSEVDYVKELIGDNFKISNPQSKSSCGCGVSFSL